jgi:hypothetical protein
MRTAWYVFVLFAIVSGSCASAQEPNRTDAQLDGFAGPVKSVSSNILRSSVKWQQPGGPTLVTPIWCRDCEYDSDGTKTKSGSVVDGKFFGEIIRLVRDANGHVTDRFATETLGLMARHDVIGPFGKTEQTLYIRGKLHSRRFFSYDGYGHVSESLSFDGTGKQVDRALTKTAKDGTVLERSVWGEHGELTWQQIYDPETQVEHFTTFDQTGKIKLTWTVIHGKLLSFWEPRESPSQFGDNFSEDVGDGNVEHYVCREDGSCELSRIHYEYLDPNKRNPISVEWRDSEGNLLFAAYYSYSIDSFRNWTYRQVWVWRPDLGDRALYETDFRGIAYWQK